MSGAVQSGGFKARQSPMPSAPSMNRSLWSKRGCVFKGRAPFLAPYTHIPTRAICPPAGAWKHACKPPVTQGTRPEHVARPHGAPRQQDRDTTHA